MLNGKKILMVENSKTIKLQIKMLLEPEGATVVDVGSEWGLFTKIAEYGVIADLIIMDLILNYEYGLDIIKKLKADPKYKNIPIIIITEKVDENTILQAKELGVKSYLRKPIKKIELIERVTKIIQESTIATTIVAETDTESPNE